MSDQDHTSHESDSSVIEDVQIKKPKKYKVILHNDDYTTMEFVIFILKVVFHKTLAEAETIMLEVHNKGYGVCGIYSFEIAESKAKKVEILAREQNHPLKCTIEVE